MWTANTKLYIPITPNISIYVLYFRFLLDVQANLPETSLFLYTQMTVLSIYFQLFIHAVWSHKEWSLHQLATKHY